MQMVFSIPTFCPFSSLPPLRRFEKTNEMLLNFNALSATRYENAAVDFRRHTALLLDMKRELDNVFRYILSGAMEYRVGRW